MKALPLSQWKELSGKRYLAIQCTSVGMHPAVDAAPVEDREFYQLIEEALDVIYTPCGDEVYAPGTGSRRQSGQWTEDAGISGSGLL